MTGWWGEVTSQPSRGTDSCTQVIGTAQTKRNIQKYILTLSRSECQLEFKDSKHWLIVRPRASFIPTIEVDGRQHQQWKLRDYFSAQLCRIYQVNFDLLNSTVNVYFCLLNVLSGWNEARTLHKSLTSLHTLMQLKRIKIWMFIKVSKVYISIELYTRCIDKCISTR